MTSTRSRPSIVRRYTQSSSADGEVGALDEVRADALGEERVLEVGAVVDARGEHGDGRVGDAVGGDRREHPVELVGVRVDRQDALLGEQVGEGPLGDRPVLQHVADAGRHPQVVLQDVHRAVGVAHQVAAGDVRPHPELGRRAAALRAEVDRLDEQVGGEHAVGDHLLVVVQVVDEVVDRPQPLLEAALDGPPLAGGDDPRDHVERPGAVDAAPVGVHGERDPQGEDVELGEVLALLQLGEAESLEEIGEAFAAGRGSPSASISSSQAARRGAQFGHRHRPTLASGCFATMPR